MVARLLAAPFPVDQLGWLPKSKQPHNGQVRAVPYLEIGAVKRRLTEVLGLDGWQTRHEIVTGPHAAVVVELRVRIGTEWLSHSDVGAAKPRANDPHQAVQAAASNGLKRAAESIGIGAYLKRLGSIWLPWNAQREQVVTDPPPQLPAWARPAMPPTEMPANGLQVAVGTLTQEFATCNSTGSFAVLRLAHRYLLQQPGLPGELGEALRRARQAAAERLKIADTKEGAA